MEQFESRYFHGEGKFFIGDRAADGSPMNLIFAGDMSSVELSPDVQRNDVVEKVTGTSAIGTSYIAAARYGLSVAMRSVKPKHFALAMQGNLSDLTADSVTDERHSAQVGAFVPLEHMGVSNVVVTQDPDGTASSLTAGTDYKVHADEGMLEILSGGSVTDGDTLGVDYDYQAQARVEADPTNTEKFCFFAGVNKADSDRFVRCEIYKVRFSPGTVSPIADDRQDFTVDGQVENDMLRDAGNRLFNWQFSEA